MEPTFGSATDARSLDFKLSPSLMICDNVIKAALDFAISEDIKNPRGNKKGKDCSIKNGFCTKIDVKVIKTIALFTFIKFCTPYVSNIRDHINEIVI